MAEPGAGSDPAGEADAKTDTDADLLFELEGVTLRIRDRQVFHGTSWRISRGEQWAVLGVNGSGKSTLVRTLTGETPVTAGRVKKSPSLRVGYVTPEQYRSLIADEIGRDFSRFAAGRPDDIATASGLLRSGLPPEPMSGRGPEYRPAQQMETLIRVMGIEPILDRPLRHLSSGEMKRLLLVRALGISYDILILDEPFDGLDTGAGRSLMEALDLVITGGATIVLITHRREEILPFINRVVIVDNCWLLAAGRREELIDDVALPGGGGTGDRAYAASGAKDRSLPEYPASAPGAGGGETGGAETEAKAVDTPGTGGDARGGQKPAGKSGEPIVELKDVTVRYGETVVLNGLTWSMYRNEHWCILGPNGSGKTTILSLIHGDNQQAYSNHVAVFGKRRGDGENLWHLRKRLGMVTPHLQGRYRKSIPVLEVILSGFYDSVGLYRRPSAAQCLKAREAARTLGIDGCLRRRFDLLSTGERTLVLIARALVNDPEILILDEPCQGLDPANRIRIIRTVNAAVADFRYHGNGDACGETGTSLLYVTHHEDEIPQCVTHRLYLTGEGRVSRGSGPIHAEYPFSREQSQ